MLKTVPATAPGYAGMRPHIQSLLAQGEVRVAFAQLAQMQSSEPDWIEDMATCYWRLGDAETGLKLLELLTQSEPHRQSAWVRRGAMAISVGDKAQAVAAYNRALKLDPKSVLILASLNRITPFERTSREARNLRKFASDRKRTQSDRANAWNAIGVIEEKAGRHAEAFRSFARCKSLGRVPVHTDLLEQHVDAQIERFDGSRAGPAATDGVPRVIFVVGMPRSGTTLVDGIFGQHPDVVSLGETPALMQSLSRLRTALRSRHGSGSDWDWYTQATDADLETARAGYLAQLAARLPGEMPGVIVEKLPLNILELGFARAILPDARFVFLSRHPLAVGLSNFATNFSQPQPYSHRLEEIARMIRLVDRAAEDYAAKLGSVFRRQSYRALVEDAETEIRALLDHGGLPWHADCLHPEKRTGAVRTASAERVRDPIDARALEKWQNYRDELHPLVAGLGGPEAIARWGAADRA